MPKPADIPFSKMQKISRSGVFVKRLGHYGESMMRPDAHRDDYYIVVLLTAGSASVEIDFEKKELNAGELLMVSPWQVHKPSGGDSNWFARFARNPNTLTRILWWVFLLTAASGIAATAIWLTGNTHSHLGAVHGKIGFLMVAAGLIHASRYLRKKHRRA